MYIDKATPKGPVEGPVKGFDGHTNGHYMTSLIQQEGFMSELLSDVGDQLVFARAYNKAAEAAGAYVFSREFMEHIENAVNTFNN